MMKLKSVYVGIYKFIAFHALRDSRKLSLRLARYNHNMSKARSLVQPNSSITAATGVHHE